MLKKTVYFRTQEDLDRFNSLANKAEWLSYKLTEKFTKGEVSNYDNLRAEKVRALKPIAEKEVEAMRPVLEKQKAGMFDRDIQFCKHNQVKGSCKKGCK